MPYNTQDTLTPLSQISNILFPSYILLNSQLVMYKNEVEKDVYWCKLSTQLWASKTWNFMQGSEKCYLKSHILKD